MKSKILLIFILFGLFSNQIKAVDTASVKYLPLEVGNVWVYYYQYNGTEGMRRVEVLKDTILANHKYFMTSITIPATHIPVPSPAFYRIDSISTNFYFYCGSGCFCIQGDELGDSLAAKKSDTSNFCNYRRVCKDTAVQVIFGNSTKTKTIYSTFSVGGEPVTYAKNFGIIYSVYGELHPTFYSLRGCVIHSIVYGDTTSHLTVINLISAITPEKFSLSQNYPNPFNPATNIKFDLPKSGFVKLTIYDALGREVTTLINSEMKAGSYNANWDASSYSSGIYFYKLETGDFVETKKMVLIK